MNPKENRILIVDDNPKNSQLIGTLIKKMGFPINLASNGAEALEILEEEKPALILCDIMMPEIDGFEFCRRIKHNYATKEIPIIFLTASNEDNDESRGLELGAVDFIRKPINPLVLTARVNTHINLQSALKDLKKQNEILVENAKLKEDVERISKHDLKNPLQAFIGIPDIILSDSNITEEQKDLLHTLQKSAYDMLEMIDRSLDLYKMEMGIYEVKYNKVDLIDIMFRIKESLNYLSEEKNLNIQFYYNCNEAKNNNKLEILGEDLLFYSMLSNLLKNAIESSPENGDISINILTDDELTIIIENQGNVPQSLQKRFFDKYATSGKEKGTGLGTYSARLITQTLNGDISLDLPEDNIVRIQIIFPNNMIVQEE